MEGGKGLQGLAVEGGKGLQGLAGEGGSLAGRWLGGFLGKGIV